MKLFFNMGCYLQLKFFFAIVIAVVLIIIDNKFNSFMKIKEYLDTVISPIYFLNDLPRQSLDNIYKKILSHRQLELENKKLRYQIFIKDSELLKLQHYKFENFLLRKLLNSPLLDNEKKTLAEVISFNKNSYSDQLIINKGMINGVYEGQSVINDQGIVGQIINVNKLTSRVLLICDISHAIPVEILRNNVRMIAYGQGCASKILNLENLPLDADIRIGDLLVSSGLGGRFPEGYPVGVVASINTDNILSCKVITAKLITNINSLHYLLLLNTNNPKEITKSINKSYKVTNDN